MGNFSNLQFIGGCNEALSKKVKEILNDNRLCLTLGGDHAVIKYLYVSYSNTYAYKLNYKINRKQIAVGSVDGHLQKSEEIGIIWIDAHADLNTNATSPSGTLPCN